MSTTTFHTKIEPFKRTGADDFQPEMSQITSEIVVGGDVVWSKSDICYNIDNFPQQMFRELDAVAYLTAFFCFGYLAEEKLEDHNAFVDDRWFLA